MTAYRLRKILIVLVILIPVVSFHSCKKQEKCGCDGDVLFTVTSQLMYRSEIYVTGEGSTMKFMDGYDTYDFCNPVEMYPVYSNISPSDQILLSGDVYWDCNYVSQTSQSSYYSYYKYYNIKVTELKSYLYGK